MMVRSVLCAGLVLWLSTSAVAESTPAEARPQRGLSDCLRIALEHHPDIQTAQAAQEVSHQQTWEAIASALPQVNASYSAQRRHSNAGSLTGTTLGGRTQTFNFYSTGLTFSQILFDFGQSLYGIRAAQATERSLAANVGTARETVLFDVKQSYYNLLQAQRLLVVADENVANNQKHVDLATARFGVGVATRFDITQAEVQLVNAQLSQVTARNNVAVARETFRNALGIDGDLDFDILDTLSVHDVQIDEQKAVDLAFDHRPDILSLRQQQESFDDQIKALRLSYLPTINGNATYNYSGTDYPLNNSWTVGASANLSVFNGGLTSAEIGAAKANLSQLQSQERSLRHQVRLQVRQAVLNLAQAAESIAVSEKGVESSRENLAIAEGQYGAGVGNIIALSDAQAALTTSQGNNVQSLAGYHNAVAALEQATAQTFSTETAPNGP
jgi:outer membrane protein